MNSKPITAYQCSKCNVAYMTDKVAEGCCRNPYCACGASIPRTQWRCDKCKDHADRFGWECAERNSLPKDGWLYSETNDEYFCDIENFMLSREFEEQELGELVAMLDNPSEFARKYQVYICKAHKPGLFDLNDYYEDHCFEDHELPGNWQQANNAVNDWIASVSDNEWPQVPSTIAWDGEYADD
jgi:mRNA-degrading endonuclease YafQ of YafQ-DinJ toxin-antitoxin module